MKKSKSNAHTTRISKGQSRSGAPTDLRIDAHTDLRPYYNPSKVRAAGERFVMGSALISGRIEIGQGIVDLSDKIYRLGMRAAVESSPGGDAFLDFLEQEGERLCHIMITGKVNALPGLGWYPRALIFARSGSDRAAAKEAKERKPGEPRGRDTWRLRTAISLHPNVIGDEDDSVKRIIEQSIEHKMSRIDEAGDFIVVAIADKPKSDDDDSYPSTAFAAFHCDGGAWAGWIETDEQYSTLGLTLDKREVCLDMVESELASLRVMSHLRSENLSEAAIRVLREVTGDDRSLGMHEQAIRKGLEPLLREVKEHVVSDLFMQLHVTESAHYKHISRMARDLYSEMKQQAEDNDAGREREKRRHIDQVKAQEKQAKSYLERAGRAETEVSRLFKRVKELETAQRGAASSAQGDAALAPGSENSADAFSAGKPDHAAHATTSTSGLPSLWDEVFG